MWCIINIICLLCYALVVSGLVSHTCPVVTLVVSPALFVTSPLCMNGDKAGVKHHYLRNVNYARLSANAVIRYSHTYTVHYVKTYSNHIPKAHGKPTHEQIIKTNREKLNTEKTRCNRTRKHGSKGRSHFNRHNKLRQSKSDIITDFLIP